MEAENRKGPADSAIEIQGGGVLERAPGPECGADRVRDGSVKLIRMESPYAVALGLLLMHNNWDF